jgi:hypothetical protein
MRCRARVEAYRAAHLQHEPGDDAVEGAVAASAAIAAQRLLHSPALVAEPLLASAQSFEVRGSFRDVSV